MRRVYRGGENVGGGPASASWREMRRDNAFVVMKLWLGGVNGSLSARLSCFLRVKLLARI